MSNSRKIRQAIKEIVGSGGSALFMAEVEAVDGRVCTVKIGTLKLTGVRLTSVMSSGDDIVITPHRGSIVVVGDLSGGELRELIVVQYGKIESIVINGGTLGGMAVVPKLVEWMQKVYGDLQTLKGQLSTHPVAGNGAVLGLTFNTQTPSPVASNFENPKIKQ